MTEQELIAKYNPSNARNLSQQDLADMRNLTTEQIGALAKAYPNGARNRAYLVLYDNNVDENKQLNTLSTWQNLFNVRKFSNLKNLVPMTFRELFTRPMPARSSVNVSMRTAGNMKGVSARKVLDLSAQEAAKELQANAAAAAGTAKVTAGKGAVKAEIPPAAGTKIADANELAKKEAKPRRGAVVKGNSSMRALPIKEEAAPGKQVPADQEFTDGGAGGQ